VSENLHARAEELIAKERVEGLLSFERNELASHLQKCSRCAEHARQTDSALRRMRTAAIPFPAGLAARTQFRVRLRAQELQEREPQRRALWFACAISWVFGIASAPFVWRVFAWIGERTGVPKLFWEIGFGLWWTIPALFAVIVLFLENASQSNQFDWIKQDR
jgi:anti-sigma factor RsiW